VAGAAAEAEKTRPSAFKPPNVTALVGPVMAFPEKPGVPKTTVEPLEGIAPSDQFNGSAQFALLFPIQVSVAAGMLEARTTLAAKAKAQPRRTEWDVLKREERVDCRWEV